MAASSEQSAVAERNAFLEAAVAVIKTIEAAEEKAIVARTTPSTPPRRRSPWTCSPPPIRKLSAARARGDQRQV